MVSGGAPSYVARSGTACTSFEPVVPETLQYKGRLRLLSRRPVDAAAAAAAEAKARGNKRPDQQKEGASGECVQRPCPLSHGAA